MKFFTTMITTALVATLTPLAAADDWRCGGTSNDAGLRRYSFQFTGYCADRYGQCFLDAIRAQGLVAHNWQCWQIGDGWWQADVSNTAGTAPSMNNAIQAVTGQWRGCWPGQ